MKYCLTIFSLLIGVISYGQTITVLDGKTKEPIDNVAIFDINKNQSVVSNANGAANLDAFDTDALLQFQHPAYQELTFTLQSIKEETTIYLTERIIKMKDVVVSANKWEQNSDEIPSKIVSISSKEIAFNNPQTAADMLSQTGEVFMQKSQLGGGSPKLRGFAANSILIVVDGVRMNNAIFRGGNLQNVINIDPNALSGSEVILGPGSVIYGSDALGGVMDFHVKSPRYSIDDDLRIHGTAFTRYSTATNENTLHTNFGIGGEKLAWFSSVSYSKFDDLKTGENRPDGYSDFGIKDFLVRKDLNGNDIVVANPNPNTQSPSGYELWSTIQKLGYKINDHLKLEYGFYLSNTSNIPRYDRLIETDNNGLPNDAEWYYGPQKWMMNNLKVEYTSPTILFDQARLVVARQDYEESRNDRGFGDNNLRTRMENVDVYSINLDFDKGIKQGNFFYGLEYLSNTVESDAYRQNLQSGATTGADTRYPSNGSSYDSYAAYLSHKFKLSKQLIINSGLRYSLVKIDASFDDEGSLNFPFSEFELNNEAVNGSLGAVYNPADDFTATLSFGTGFRSPNIDDVGKVFDFSDGEVQVPNANLKPEYTYNYEAGLEWKINDNIEIGGTVFYTQIEDAILRGDFAFNGSDSIVFDGELSKTVALQNSGEAEIYGYSVEFEALFSKHWAVDVNITNTFGRDLVNKEPLRHTTPLFGKISLLYQKDKLRAEFYTEFNSNRLREDIPSSEIDDKPFLYAMHDTDPTKDGSPQWYTLNLKCSYQIDSNILVNLGVENVLDKHYRPYSSGISAPGRNFFVTLRATL